MPVIETKGALSSQGYGEFAQSGAGPVYVEDVFSTWLYTGNSAPGNLIENGIALASGPTLTGGSVFVPGYNPSLGPSSGNANYSFGTGDFTVEGFMYLTAYPSGTGGSTTADGIFTLADGTSGGWGLRMWNGPDITFAFFQQTSQVNSGVYSSFPLNTWTHIAVTRASNTVRIFVAGTFVAQGTSAANLSLTNGPVVGWSAQTARSPNAFFSNVRINKGTALYTAAFTPPTSALTAVSGTVLLFCQNPNPLVDNSSIGAAITQTTSLPNVKSFGPFTGPTVSSTGGMVWVKVRSQATNHALYDTARGATFDLVSNSSAAQTTQTTGLTSFNTNGFSIGSLGKLNSDTAPYTSWTFKEQPKFFDVVTYTGNGVSNRTIAHNLGSVPGCIIVKRLSGVDGWAVWHRGLSAGNVMELNLAATQTALYTTWFGSNLPTSTVFNLGTDTRTNGNGSTYVAYLFAHDAGGFGATGTDNVITCGSYTGTGADPGPTITLGYEPQWVLIKVASGTANDWILCDNLRGSVATAGGSSVGILLANDSAAEGNLISGLISPSATGFTIASNNGRVNQLSSTYIYIAIRRGPMKTPTTGTSVFQPVVYTGTNVDNRLVTTGILTDFIMARQRNSTTLGGMLIGDRLRGDQYWLTGSTAVGVTDADSLMTPTLVSATNYGNSFSAMNGFGCGNDATAQLNISTVASNQVVEAFARAPGFLDVVFYTGTGANRTINHNLGVKPEMIWFKRLNVGTATAVVYTSAVTAIGYIAMSSATAAQYSATYFNNTEPTSTQFTVSTSNIVNGSANNYAAYLMASIPGVSKCSYYVGRGVGTSQQVDCGFASGVRFVLIKTVGAAGPWYVWDSARGIVAGNDPYVLLDSSAAEVTTTDYIDTYSAGFEVSTTAPIDINPGYGEVINSQAAVDGTSTMNDIVYGGGLWVVVSQAGNVSRSITGYSWTTVTGVMSIATGVTFGNGLYVVVGSSGAIATSPDAITWTARTSGVTNALNSAAYAFGKYWVVGNGGTVLSSTNGIAWSSVSSGTTEALDRIRFLNNNLVIVGTNGTIVTSSDGITFTVRTSGTTSNLRGVAFGAGLYVVTGASNTVRTSPDLVTWTARTGPTGTLNNIVWASYRFVVQSGSPGIWYSADGITWTAGVSSGIGTFGYQGMWFANDLVMSGNSDGDIYISDPRMWYWAIA